MEGDYSNLASQADPGVSTQYLAPLCQSAGGLVRAEPESSIPIGPFLDVAGSGAVRLFPISAQSFSAKFRAQNWSLSGSGNPGPKAGAFSPSAERSDEKRTQDLSHRRAISPDIVAAGFLKGARCRHILRSLPV